MGEAKSRRPEMRAVNESYERGCQEKSPLLSLRERRAVQF